MLQVFRSLGPTKVDQPAPKDPTKSATKGATKSHTTSRKNWLKEMDLHFSLHILYFYCTVFTKKTIFSKYDKYQDKVIMALHFPKLLHQKECRNEAHNNLREKKRMFKATHLPKPWKVYIMDLKGDA